MELYLCTSSAAMPSWRLQGQLYLYSVDVLRNSLNIYRRGLCFERKLQKKEAHILYLIQFTVKSYDFLDN